MEGSKAGSEVGHDFYLVLVLAWSVVTVALNPQ